MEIIEAVAILEEHTAEAYGKIPRLKEIDDEVATLSADKVRRLLNGEEKGTSDLKAAIQELSDERITLLVANGFPGDYLEMPYTCPDCQDTVVLCLPAAVFSHYSILLKIL